MRIYVHKKDFFERFILMLTKILQGFDLKMKFLRKFYIKFNFKLQNF